MDAPINTGKLVPLEKIPGIESPPENLDFPVVVASGPLTLQPCTLPYRIVVLAYKNGNYSVHSQCFIDGNGSFSNGHYFQAGEEGLNDAIVKFSERLLATTNSLKSIYREEENLQ